MKKLLVSFGVTALALALIVISAQYVFHIPVSFFATQSGAVAPAPAVVASGSVQSTDTSSGDTLVASETGTTACTTEYTPVCGADGQTYSNACMANTANTIVANDGECEATGATASGAATQAQATSTGTTSAGNTYQNKTYGYSFSLPKYAYYAGLGAQAGATHVVAIGLSAADADSLSAADVRVYYYGTVPANPPAWQQITLAHGVLYVDGNTANPKVAQIINSIVATAK